MQPCLVLDRVVGDRDRLDLEHRESEREDGHNRVGWIRRREVVASKLHGLAKFPMWVRRIVTSTTLVSLRPKHGPRGSTRFNHAALAKRSGAGVNPPSLRLPDLTGFEGLSQALDWDRTLMAMWSWHSVRWRSGALNG